MNFIRLGIFWILCFLSLSIPTLRAGITVEIHASRGHELGGRDETDIRDALTFLHDYFDQVYHFRSSFKLPIHLLSRDEFALTLQNSRVKNAAGFYYPHSNQIFMDASYQKEFVLKTLYHEACHGIFYQGLKMESIPPWINEGLAEYFETLTFTSGQTITVEPNPLYLEWLRYWKRQGQLMSVENFIAASYDEFHGVGMKFQDDQAPNPARPIAWGLVYFIMGKDKNGHLMRDFLGDLRTTAQSPQDMMRSLEKIFRAPFAQIETNWRDMLDEDPEPHVYPLMTRKVTLQ